MPYLDKQVDILTRFGRVVESKWQFFFSTGVEGFNSETESQKDFETSLSKSSGFKSMCRSSENSHKKWVQVFFVRGVKETTWHGGPGFKDRVQVQASSLKSKSDSLSRGLSDSSLLGVQATDDKSESDSWGFRFVSTSSVAKSKSRYRSWTQVVFPWP